MLPTHLRLGKCPFPRYYHNLGCSWTDHIWKRTEAGISQLFWYGHVDGEGNKVYKHVPVSQTECKKCHSIQDWAIHSVKDMKYAMARGVPKSVFEPTFWDAQGNSYQGYEEFKNIYAKS